MTDGWGFDDRDNPAWSFIVWRHRYGVCLYRPRSLFSGLGILPAGYTLVAMENMDILIEQMISEISSRAVRLDDIRLKKFLEWLNTFSSKVRIVEQFHMEVAVHSEGAIEDRLRDGLKQWLESLSIQNLLLEYRLILDEISWWHDLDPHSLSRILKSEGRD